MNEIHPEKTAAAEAPAKEAVRDVPGWRKAERARLIAERMATPAAARTRASAAIARRLDGETGAVRGRTVGIYWPFRAEPDLREWGAGVIERGGRIALPVVVAKARPLVFRAWAPGEKLEKGVWNIPVPAGGEEVLPDIVVAPLVGFDDEGYRLGYGGGFYDRTLAAMPRRPLAVGVGFAFARLETIHPQWHDVRLDRLVIEDLRD